MDFIAAWLTAGVKFTNMLFRLLFFSSRGLKVYPRLSDWQASGLSGVA
ncbi:hypothetical protein [Marinobacter lipolyticus]|nr:hypothetical protein [Marinobacter lipolyticus]